MSWNDLIVKLDSMINTNKNSSNSPIQGLWIGKLGMLERLSMASFLAHGHRYHLYAYDDLENVPQGVEIHDASEIIPRDHIFQYQHGKSKGGYSGFANLFRYRLLQLKGGWWCDTDIVCLKPFYFQDEIVLAYARRHYVKYGWHQICNNVMFCPPGHPFISACYEEAIHMDPLKLKFTQNGEPVLRRNVNKLHLKHCIKPPNIFNPIDWFNSDFLAQPGSANHIPAESYSVHCFRENWRRRLKENQENEFRNNIFAPDTILGALQRRYLPAEVL